MNPFAIENFFDLRDFPHKELFIGTYVWEALIHLHDYLKRQKLGQIEIELPSSAYLIDGSLVSIGKGTIVEPGAYIQGPCIIGEDCQIRHGAYIRGGVVTGRGCVIGHDTEIKNSILLNEAHAAHFNYVGDSILGNRVNLGAGVKCANLRLDRETVLAVAHGEKISTELKKLGAIIGDDTQIGCNSVTNPGTFLGKKSLCRPCLNIGGYFSDSSMVKNSN
jgi:NDP-sugar pyrophosphorylase family protein